MIVCVCNAVTGTDIRQAVAEGCHSLDAIAARTGATTGCGTCRHAVRCALADETQPRSTRDNFMLQTLAAGTAG